ncbi:MAG: hypothetical protein ACQEQC_04445 [Elusimicrobiota bacterium]
MILMLLSWIILSGDVAIHYGSGGVADRWVSSFTHSFNFMVLHTGLFILFYFLPRLTFSIPDKWLFIPNKDYWLTPENKSKAADKLSGLIYKYGISVFILLFGAGILSIQANLQKPVELNVSLLLIFVFLFAVYSVVWSIELVKVFDIPEKESPSYNNT